MQKKYTRIGLEESKAHWLGVAHANEHELTRKARRTLNKCIRKITGLQKATVATQTRR